MVARKYRLLHIGRVLLDWSNPQPGGIRGFLRTRVARYLEWNQRLLLDPWLRYQPAIAALNESHPRPSRILDAGSGGYGLAHFVHLPVVGVDVRFSVDEMAVFPSPIQPVLASAPELPFRDAAFDAVVSMDMLEHVPSSMRFAALEELFRVSRALIIIGFPYGQASSDHDKRALIEELRRGIAPLWREEHVRNGLPGQQVHDRILEIARNSAPRWDVGWFSHEGLVGLQLRWKLQLMLGVDSRLRGVILAPLYLVHARGRRARGYRRVYVIRRAANTV